MMRLKLDMVRRIGLHYHRLSIGGIERVIAFQLKTFVDLGFEVTFFCENLDTIGAYEIPSSVKVVAFPSSEHGVLKCGLAREEAIVKTLTHNPVDIFYSHAYASSSLKEDIRTIRRRLGINFVLHVHNIFTAALYTRSDARHRAFLESSAIHRECTRVIVLSRADELFERALGVNAVYLPNPVIFQKHKISEMDRCSQNLLWVGRFSPEKRPLEALRVLAELRKSCPNATMTMVGGGQAGYEADVRAEIRRLKLSDAVKLTGLVNDVDPWYEKSSVLLLTSAIEGFPMVSLEAMRWGLPIVAYELEHVETFRDNEDVVQIPQGDASAAATAIKNLFEDSKLASRRVRQRSRYKSLADFDYSKAVKMAFEHEISTDEDNIDLNDCRILVRTLLAGIDAILRQGCPTDYGYGRLPFLSGLIDCMRENGWRYTWRHLLGKMWLRKGA